MHYQIASLLLLTATSHDAHSAGNSGVPENPSSQWIYAATNETGDEFSVRQRDIDARQPDNQKIAWVMQRSSPDVMITRVLFRFLFNCINHTSVTDYRIFYKDDGTLDQGYATPWLTRKPIVPGSVNESIADKVCHQ